MGWGFCDTRVSLRWSIGGLQRKKKSVCSESFGQQRPSERKKNGIFHTRGQASIHRSKAPRENRNPPATNRLANRNTKIKNINNNDTTTTTTTTTATDAATATINNNDNDNDNDNNNTVNPALTFLRTPA